MGDDKWTGDTFKKMAAGYLVGRAAEEIVKAFVAPEEEVVEVPPAEVHSGVAVQFMGVVLADGTPAMGFRFGTMVGVISGSINNVQRFAAWEGKEASADLQLDQSPSYRGKALVTDRAGDFGVRVRGFGVAPLLRIRTTVAPSPATDAARDQGAASRHHYAFNFGEPWDAILGDVPNALNRIFSEVRNQLQSIGTQIKQFESVAKKHVDHDAVDKKLRVVWKELSSHEKAVDSHEATAQKSWRKVCSTTVGQTTVGDLVASQLIPLDAVVEEDVDNLSEEEVFDLSGLEAERKAHERRFENLQAALKEACGGAYKDRHWRTVMDADRSIVQLIRTVANELITISKTAPNSVSRRMMRPAGDILKLVGKTASDDAVAEVRKEQL